MVFMLCSLCISLNSTLYFFIFLYIQLCIFVANDQFGRWHPICSLALVERHSLYPKNEKKNEYSSILTFLSQLSQILAVQLICKCVEIQYYSLVGAKSVVELTGVHVSWLDLDNIASSCFKVRRYYH